MDGGVSDGGLLFASDWGTARGTGTDALRDTGKRLPWEVVLGAGLTVIDAAGLDFPTPNVLEVMGVETAAGSGLIRFGQPRISGLPVPEVGQSLYYRWYFRTAVPDSIDTDSGGAPHPIQDGQASSQTNWMFETTISRDGGWGPRLFNFPAPFPDNRWGAPAPLRKHQTYRFELQLHRVTATTFTPHVRVYDSAGTLLISDAEISNSGGASAATLATNPELPIRFLDNLGRFQVGNNGPGWTVPSNLFPFPMFYQGAVCIRADTWCGPYQPGEGL
jgi:hypothetical protein